MLPSQQQQAQQQQQQMEQEQQAAGLPSLQAALNLQSLYPNLSPLYQMQQPHFFASMLPPGMAPPTAAQLYAFQQAQAAQTASLQQFSASLASQQRFMTNPFRGLPNTNSAAAAAAAFAADTYRFSQLYGQTQNPSGSSSPGVAVPQLPQNIRSSVPDYMERDLGEGTSGGQADDRLSRLQRSASTDVAGLANGTGSHKMATSVSQPTPRPASALGHLQAQTSGNDVRLFVPLRTLLIRVAYRLCWRKIKS